MHNVHETVCNNTYVLGYVSDLLKTQEISEKTVEEYPCQLKDVSGCLKTQEMCDKAVKDGLPLCSLHLIGL